MPKNKAFLYVPLLASALITIDILASSNPNHQNPLFCAATRKNCDARKETTAKKNKPYTTQRQQPKTHTAIDSDEPVDLETTYRALQSRMMVHLDAHPGTRHRIKPDEAADLLTDAKDIERHLEQYKKLPECWAGEFLKVCQQDLAKIVHKENETNFARWLALESRTLDNLTLQQASDLLEELQSIAAAEEKTHFRGWDKWVFHELSLMGLLDCTEERIEELQQEETLRIKRVQNKKAVLAELLIETNKEQSAEREERRKAQLDNLAARRDTIQSALVGWELIQIKYDKQLRNVALHGLGKKYHLLKSCLDTRQMIMQERLQGKKTILHELERILNIVENFPQQTSTKEPKKQLRPLLLDFFKVLNFTKRQIKHTEEALEHSKEMSEQTKTTKHVTWNLTVEEISC